MAQVSDEDFRRCAAVSEGWGQDERGPRGALARRLRLGEVSPAVLAAIAVLAVAAVVLGCVLVACQPRGVVVARDAEGAAAAAAGGEEDGADQAGGGAGEEAAPAVRVHVAGAVASPGVYAVPEGSCVWDAVQAAGGFSDDADRDALNLAASVGDGMKVTVPACGQEDGDVAADLVQEGAQAQASSGLVNVNTASVEELQALTGVGPSTAQAIVDERMQNGPFSSVEDLVRVSGIGQKKLASILGEACV